MQILGPYLDPPEAEIPRVGPGNLYFNRPPFDSDSSSSLRPAMEPNLVYQVK